MGNRILEEDKVVSSLEQSFSINKMILFVGAEDDKDILTPEILQLPWSCVITSQKGEAFKDYFNTQQRQIREYCTLSDLPANIFDGKILPIVRLYGNADPELLDEEDDELLQETIEDDCNKMLTNIMHKLDFTMQLVIIGYHPGVSGEVKRSTLLLRLKDCNGAKISFFGLQYKDADTEKLKASLSKQGVDFYEETLGKMLSRKSIEIDDENIELTYNADELFYKGGKAFTIRRSLVLRYREAGTLLTEGLINDIRPFGRIQQSRWFLNFLTRSSVEGPQWYGYLPQSEFYLKRSYEDALFQLVSQILSGKENLFKDYSNPVILEGDSASSKSVVLAAIAYKIFIERENPVIFIDKNRLNSREDIEELDGLMQEIEGIGNRDSKILIVWDGSSYQNVDSMARNIAKQLDNRGRKFLLVCSSYRNVDIASETDNRSKFYRYYKLNGLDIVETNREEMSIAQNTHTGNYYVHASDELSDKEMVDLRNKVKLYIPDMKSQLDAKWAELKRDGNKRLFDYLYKLIVVLQPPLELGLDKERKKFVQYAQDLFNKEVQSEDSSKQVMNPMLEALVKAGFTTDEIEIIDQPDEEITESDIHRMNICIALFSRFKLDCSVRLAIYILRASQKGADIAEVYSSKNRKLLNIITTSMPWILYKPNADNVFCFYYRSALEAEIFLTNKKVSPLDEIDMICEMMKFYADDYRQNGSPDPALKLSLQRLIRMIGPNSDYFAFKTSNNNEHNELMKHLDKIIDKLYWLRTEVGIEDSDASFANLEITFLREFYATNWHRDKYQEVKRSISAGNECEVWEAYPDIFTEDSYVLRLNKLNEAVDLATQSIDWLQASEMNGWEKQAVASTVNTLVVELSLCNIRLEELRSEYDRFCEKHNITGQNILMEIRPMSYNSLYRMLIKAIHENPVNGYAYNALFRLFVTEYEKADNTKRYELLSGIRPLVDDAENYEIENRGSQDRDELTGYISKIRNYSSKVKVSIQTLDSKQVDDAFLSLFDDMLMRGNASVITFVCQQELDQAKLTNFKSYDLTTGESINYKLRDSQIRKCKEIVEFMQREEYVSCIENDANALYLQLKVTWMAYNEYPIMDGSVECRPTYLSKDQWIEINRICGLYNQCAGTTRKPIIILLQALSIIQISGDFIEANRLLESLREDMFLSLPRMRVPYLLCNEDGSPWPFSGKVIGTEENRHRGFIKVDNIPQNIGTKTGIRFYQKNLGLKSMPHQNDILYDLEMGIGYMGFSMYTSEGRKRLEAR